MANEFAYAKNPSSVRGYEGLVAKDPESPYVGGRALKWLKVKQLKYREAERGFYDPKRA